MVTKTTNKTPGIYQLDFIKKVIDKTGPRLPGSKEEKIGAKLIAKEFEKISGKKAIIEKFEIRPFSTFPIVPFFAIFLGLACIFYFFLPYVSLILSVLVLFFFLAQIFFDFGWFDFLFPKRLSQNVYQVIEPKNKKVDYTLVLSGHHDSAWRCNLTSRNPEFAWLKASYTFLSYALLLVLSIFRILQSHDLINWAGQWTLFASIFFIPGALSLALFFNVIEKKKASPGAADNLSGVSTVLWFAKYFKENPEEIPKRCRIVFVAFGAEEIGMKGSRAFVKRHKKGILKGDVWNLNIDGIFDKDTINLPHSELYSRLSYDRGFFKIVEKFVKKERVKYNSFKIPMGGTDASSFIKHGKKAITITTYGLKLSRFYHTHLDTVENIHPESLNKVNRVCLNTIKEIDKRVHGSR